MIKEWTKWRRIPTKIRHLARSNLDLIVTGAETSEKIVSLTFDDGPNPLYTPRILDLLDRYSVKATFFVVGKLASKYPSIIERIQASGHAIGNHTWNHSPVPLLGRRERIRQIRNTQQLFNNHGEKLFRPPWGFINLAAYTEAILMGYKVIFWGTSLRDWLNPSAEEVLQRLDTKIKPGSIILMHDNLCDTVKPEYASRDNLIEGLEKCFKKYTSEYKFVTVPQLLSGRTPTYKYGLLRKSEKTSVIPESALSKIQHGEAFC
jgi:peptidoglycan/xylan/chitin deacetylase (PgdA/CDA1 family)